MWMKVFLILFLPLLFSGWKESEQPEDCDLKSFEVFEEDSISLASVLQLYSKFDEHICQTDKWNLT